VGPLQEHDDAPYVSTGHLPSPEQVRGRSTRPTSATADARWAFLLDGLSRFAGRALALDGFGNSVKGQLAARFLSRRLG
jgi:hypothetical protein